MNYEYIVTGANGYIGKNLLKRLKKEGAAKIYAITRESVDEKVEEVTYIKADIFKSPENIYKLVSEKTILIHLAWKNGFDHESESHIYEIALHYKFINRVIELGCVNINVIGSVHEIGFYEGKVSRDTICNPITRYGIAKNTLRQLLLGCLAKEKNVYIKWLRVYYIYGDDARSQSIFSKLIGADKLGINEFRLTKGQNKFDFIEIEELTEQISKASVQTEYCGTIELCSGNAVSLKEQVIWFKNNNKLKINLIFGAFPERKAESPCIYGDNSIIRKICMEKK